jgi:hypothetical protein
LLFVSEHELGSVLMRGDSPAGQLHQRAVAE